MRTLLPQPALDFEERGFTVLDLVVAGVQDGRWAALERDAAIGMAAAAVEEPPADAVHAAGNAFRYERSLLAREDLERWLDARGLTVDDWRGHLRRRLAREAAPETAGGDPEPVLRVDALCSGALAECAQEVVAGAAAARAVGLVDVPADATLVERARATVALATVADDELAAAALRAAQLADARLRLEQHVAAGDAVAERIRSNGLEWLRFRTEEVTSPSEDAAREARLCIREDGASVAEVAVALGVDVVERTRVFGETQDELAARLAVASPGDVVGPYPTAGGFLLARLVEKARPSLDDSDVVERARSQLLDEAIAQHAAGRVTWHVAL